MPQSQNNKFKLTAQETKKLNLILPKGYKLVTPQELRKKNISKPKKKTIMGLPVTQQIVNQSIKLLDVGKVKTKFSAIDIEDNSATMYQIPVFKSVQKIPIPISLDFYNQIDNSSQNFSTVATFSKLKNYPLIESLYKINMPSGNLTFRDIQKKVSYQKQNYKINELINDISKICLKVYQSQSRDSNEYQNTVSIQKYLKSLTKTQKIEPVVINTSFVKQGTNMPKKKNTSRNDNLNTVITIKQKRQLGQRIKKLPSQCLQQICLIVFQNLQNKEYSFDLDTLHLKKIRQLQDYVNSRGDIAQLRQMNEQSNKDQIDDGEQSSFIIEDDGEQIQNTTQYDD